MTFYTKLTKQKSCKLSSAFTMIELLVVIIIIGIIVATLSFDFSPNRLKLGTDQLIKDLRFTQSLALKDDKYQPFPKSTSLADQNQSKYWFKQWWQLRIGITSNGDYFYEIFSDSNPFNNKGGPVNEFAIDPQTKKYLTGNYTANTDEDLNLSKFGITNIQLSNGANITTNNSFRLLFDNYGNVFLSEGGTELNPLYNKNLLTQEFTIKLCKDNACNKYCEIKISSSGDVYKGSCSN